MMSTIDEATRHALYDHFVAQMGEDLAGVFMNVLSSAAWGDLATRQDVLDLKQDVALNSDVMTLKGDVMALTGDVMALKGDVMALKGDVKALKEDVADLKHDMRAVRQEMVALEVRLNERLDDKLETTESRLRSEIAGVRTEMHQGFRRMTIWVASLQVATFGAVSALAVRIG